MPHTLYPKIVFMGTPEFGAIILEKLCQANLKPILVITTLDKPIGRKQVLTAPSVKIMAERYKIPVFQPRHILDSRLQILDSDLIIVAAFGQILPRKILEIPKYGCLNVHPSLLPKYRGPSPIQYTILNGDKKTGVSIMLMDEKIDHGPVLASREWEIPNPKSQILNKSQIQNSKITYGELLKELANLGANLLIETIPKWTRGEIKPRPQNESKATYTKILKKQDGKIDWIKKPEEIERQIRAFNPWPGTYTIYNEKILKILKAEISEGKLIIKEVQLEGKKPISFKDFLRGYPNFVYA